MRSKSSSDITLRVLACGGTFDKHYLPLTGVLGFADSHLPAILQRARVDQLYDCTVLPLQDSLDMQDADRQRVLEACRAAAETALVIVHGTDTMTVTAAVLRAAALAKTIVLTGAMIPYAVDDSDALFNLGFACAGALLLPHGVYVAMNGRVFESGTVRKNRELGRFETA